MTWYAIVRFEPDFIDVDGKKYQQPPDGVPILIYADKERAEMVNKGNGDNYRVVPVETCR